MFHSEVIQFLKSLPPPDSIAIRVTLTTEKKIHEGDPWVFADHILKQSQPGKAGDIAILFDHKNRFLALGLLDPEETIRIRILQRKPATIQLPWFIQQIEAAFQKRKILETQRTTGFRVLNGENEGFPGLVVDCYAQTLVLKLYTRAWLPHLMVLTQALAQILTPERMILRLSRMLQESQVFPPPLADGTIFLGKPIEEPVRFSENGLIFEVDPVHGQKTGFFLDQRENRMKVESFSANKTVLNVFAYTGGFSLYAARGKAKSVLSVDLSRPALESAVRNFALNQHFPSVASVDHQILVSDAFESLREMKNSNRSFDMVILDPPAFAKKKSEVPKALSAYQRLLRLGLGVLAPGGFLVMASCSQPIPSELFFPLIIETARGERRNLKELERTGQALDHPVAFKGGQYLKCLFARVE
ncbi:MAG: class I SAM-dependent rRNA methyltransferase [Planctomycetota bacterium]